MSKNIKIPAIANTLNADLIPKIQKWLKTHYPDAKFTFDELSTLMVLATVPNDFKKLATLDTLLEPMRNGELGTVNGITKHACADLGLVKFQELLIKLPDATLAVMLQFRNEDRKLKNNKLRKIIRSLNCEPMNNSELARYIYDLGVVGSDVDTIRTRLRELRNEDQSNLKDAPVDYLQVPEHHLRGKKPFPRVDEK